MPQPPTDNQLASQALTAPEAFGHLIQRYEAPLTRYLRRLARLSTEDIEDLLQEIFLKAYRHLNDFDPELKFSSWIYRIAHNETLNFIRSHRTTEPLYTEDPTTPNLIDTLQSDLSLPAELSRQLDARHLRQAISHLPLDYREAIILYYFEEKTYDELSDILKKPTGTVATLLSRARAQLKKSPLLAKIK